MLRWLVVILLVCSSSSGFACSIPIKTPFQVHATLLESQVDWQCIALPEIGSGWVKGLDMKKIVSVVDGDEGAVYSFSGHNIVILSHDASHLMVRDEQPSDMWCEGGNPPALQAYQEKALYLGQLYDSKCELLIKPAYIRGC